MLSVFWGAWLGACQRRAGGASQVIDSAGVSIVVNHRSTVPDALYIVDALPLVEIGSHNDPRYLFSSSLNLDMAPLSDGKIIVSDLRSCELRVFTREGAWVKTFGGRGSGPGEFRSLELVGAMDGDSIVTFDAVLQRLTIFSGDGVSVRTLTWPLGDTTTTEGRVRWIPVTVGNDGTIIAMSHLIYTDPRGAGVWREPARVALIPRSGQPRFLASRFPGVEAGATSSGYQQVLFGKRTYFGLVNGLIYAADNGSGTIDLYTYHGDKVRSIRKAVPPPPATESQFDSLARSWADQSDDPKTRQQLYSIFARSPRSNTIPVFSGVVPSETGELWVLQFRVDQTHSQRRYSVLGRTGHWLSDVNLPAAFEPKWIGKDRIVGIWTDADDVPHFRVYRYKNVAE